MPSSLQAAPVSKTIRARSFISQSCSVPVLYGVFRVPILVPRIGERWAELVEMPLMAAVIFFAAGYVLHRFPEICSPGWSLVAGFLALALSVTAELGLAVLLQNQTLAEFIKSRDKISGSVYIGLLLVFAITPRIRLSNHASEGPYAARFNRERR